MAWFRRLRDLASGAALRRRSARFRLTALYCCLFFPSGVVLCVITYVVIVLTGDRTVLVKEPQVHRHTAVLGVAPAHGGAATGGSALPPQGGGTGRIPDGATVTLPGHIVLDPREFLVGSCIVLLAMVVISVLLGWLVAGRVLRPLRVMTTTTRRISERNLHERLALVGPDDELKALSDTIDGLLDRLEAAFDSQRRFVANASHELRTPLMLSQTLIQVALADPDASVDSLRSACQEAVDAGKDQAQLIDALLALARSQRGLDHKEAVPLTAVVGDVIDAHRPSAAARGLHLDIALDGAEVSGDARLIHRLASNLVDNAIRYNIAGGRVGVDLAARATEATLTVANTGPPVPPDDVERLLEPFQRAVPDRTASPVHFGSTARRRL